MALERPKKRGDCKNGPRPCPWIGCKWHLFWEMPRKEVEAALGESDDAVIEYIWEMKDTCVLDVADCPENTLEDVGQILKLTRERIRQISGAGPLLKGGAIRRLKHVSRSKYLRDFAEGELIEQDQWKPQPGSRSAVIRRYFNL